MLALGKRIKEACANAGALFIVDNRADLAVALDADGIHVGHTDLPVSVVRAMVGHRKIVGVSSHSLPEALAAQRAGADYVSCGPIWPTPTKPQYNAVGLNLIGLYKAALKVPFVAIGGVDEKNIDQVVSAGAKCVAVVRALFESPDPEAMAKLLKGRILCQVN
jgi:thiamine-phosphate pyrophosphorylase